jgi:hypothetical protein
VKEAITQNHGTFVLRRVFGVQGLTKTVCATFCATFMARQTDQMKTGKKRVLYNVCNGFVSVASNHKKPPEMAIFQILSPVRLPFRHTGTFRKR